MLPALSPNMHNQPNTTHTTCNITHHSTLIVAYTALRLLGCRCKPPPHIWWQQAAACHRGSKCRTLQCPSVCCQQATMPVPPHDKSSQEVKSQSEGATSCQSQTRSRPVVKRHASGPRERCVTKSKIYTAAISGFDLRDPHVHAAGCTHDALWAPAHSTTQGSTLLSTHWSHQQRTAPHTATTMPQPQAMHASIHSACQGPCDTGPRDPISAHTTAVTDIHTHSTTGLAEGATRPACTLHAPTMPAASHWPCRARAHEWEPHTCTQPCRHSMQSTTPQPALVGTTHCTAHHTAAHCLHQHHQFATQRHAVPILDTAGKP
jgi:hypothetical protein